MPQTLLGSPIVRNTLLFISGSVKTFLPSFSWVGCSYLRVILFSTSNLIQVLILPLRSACLPLVYIVHHFSCLRFLILHNFHNIFLERIVNTCVSTYNNNQLILKLIQQFEHFIPILLVVAYYICGNSL